MPLLVLFHVSLALSPDAAGDQLSDQLPTSGPGVRLMEPRRRTLLEIVHEYDRGKAGRGHKQYHNESQKNR